MQNCSPVATVRESRNGIVSTGAGNGVTSLGAELIMEASLLLFLAFALLALGSFCLTGDANCFIKLICGSLLLSTAGKCLEHALVKLGFSELEPMLSTLTITCELIKQAVRVYYHTQHSADQASRNARAQTDTNTQLTYTSHTKLRRSGSYNVPVLPFKDDKCAYESLYKCSLLQL